MAAQIDEALVAIAGDPELGRAMARRGDAELRRQPVDDGQVQVDEAAPRPLQDLPEAGQGRRQEWRAGVELAEGRDCLRRQSCPSSISTSRMDCPERPLCRTGTVSQTGPFGPFTRLRLRQPCLSNCTSS